MFGYIKPFEPELRVKELTAYKAVYCGLCGQLGRSFGPPARLSLSYDFTFFSMLYWAVNNDTPQVERRRCYVNPLKKHPICTEGEALVLGADVAIILLYYKLIDNIQDSSFPAKAGWGCLRPIVGQAHKKAALRRPEYETVIAKELARQLVVEQQGSADLDAAADPFAALLGGIFRLLSTDRQQSRVLERLGYLLGRYIYLCDALDDLEQDVRTNNYNPLVIRYRLQDNKDADWDTARNNAVESLYMTIGEAEKTLTLLSLQNFAPIIENIICLGLRASVEEILAKKVKTND